MDIYPSAKPGSPVIYLNTFSNAVNSVYKNLMALGCPDFCLVAVSNLKWDHDMTPWYMGPISKHDTPCTGGADDYLKLLLDEIMPEAEALLPGAPAWRGLAGYSLAGLFALYALYQTDVFARAASMSGSFWFEGIMEYVCSHEMKRKPDCLYFSLGDKESSTDNPIFERCAAEYAGDRNTVPRERHRNHLRTEQWQPLSGVQQAHSGWHSLDIK